MKTTLHRHQVEGLPNNLTITVVDEPNHAGACHRYDVTGFDTGTNASIELSPKQMDTEMISILFQNGVPSENGFNGLTIETLLAICEDRLEGFQSGPFACVPNQVALDHIRVALDTLKERTASRLKRGVEGKDIL